MIALTSVGGCISQLRLKIQPNPPKFPFRDHPFELTVYMVDPSDHLKSGCVILWMYVTWSAY
jgi:hypothetical protein